MRGIAKVSLAVLMLFALVVMANGMAFAEEPDNVNVLIEEQVHQTYKEYHYPQGNRMFYLPRWHEVKFDVHNGKFFLVKYLPHHNRYLESSAEEDFKATVFFYSPMGELFGQRRITNLEKNRYHSVPHNDRSPHYERLIVKIQNNQNFNKDFKFYVLDPVDPVMGTPMKNATFRVIFE